MIYKVTSLQALLRKAFRTPGVLVLGDFGIFCLFLPRASREVKINRKCLTCLPKLGSSATGNNSQFLRRLRNFRLILIYLITIKTGLIGFAPKIQYNFCCSEN